MNRLARLITEFFAPAVLAATMPLVVGLHSGRTIWSGLGWGLLTVLFSAVVPYGVIRLLMRAGKVDGDHHIGDRRQRRLPIALGALSVVLGTLLLVILGAPRELVAMAAVMLAVLASAGAVNLSWKLSAHTAVAAGSAAVLAILFSEWTLVVTVPVTCAIAWSRVRLRDHTPPQVTAGTILGGAIAVAVWLATVS